MSPVECSGGDIFVRRSRAPDETLGRPPAEPPTVSEAVLTGKALAPRDFHIDYRAQMVCTLNALGRMFRDLTEGMQGVKISELCDTAFAAGEAAPVPRRPQLESLDRDGLVVLVKRLLDSPRLLQKHSAVAAWLVNADYGAHPVVPLPPAPKPTKPA